uniref:Putative kunitz peptide n=1 Tax=Tabanus bromius TaxID=304241 RepID=A0A0K8TRK3_TABBR
MKFVLLFAVLAVALSCVWADLPQECYQPRFEGMCDALFERYFYDAEAAECKFFYYGGCGGNENNFPSKDACEIRCKVRDYSAQSFEEQ